LLTICIYLCAAAAEDLDSIHEIRSEVEELIKGTEELNHGLQKVKDVQKGIEEKFKHQRDEIELIAGLEVAIAKLESNVQSSFQATASGVGNLTAIVNAIQGQNECVCRRAPRRYSMSWRPSWMPIRGTCSIVPATLTTASTDWPNLLLGRCCHN